MAENFNPSQQAFHDALGLTPFDASRVRAILFPQDWQLIDQLCGLPFAEEVYRRIWHLRQLESAVGTMNAVCRDIESHIRMLDLGVGREGELMADQFVTDVTQADSRPPRTVKIYRPPCECEEDEPPKDEAKASHPHEIGELPPIADPDGRASASHNFKRFCKQYFPERCNTWQASQTNTAVGVDEAKGHIRRLVFQIGRRGRGVTTQCAIAAIDEALYGRSKYIVIVARSREAAEAILSDIKYELTSNERLANDFPEVCVPLLEPFTKVRRKLQTHRGKPTAIEWERNRLQLPTIKGSQSSGIVIEAKSIHDQFVGMVHTDDGGKRTRPDFVLVDDPVNEADAPDELAKLEQKLETIIQKLPGVTSKLSGVMFFTPDDTPPDERIRTRESEAAAAVRKMAYRLKRRFGS